MTPAYRIEPNSACSESDLRVNRGAVITASARTGWKTSAVPRSGVSLASAVSRKCDANMVLDKQLECANTDR
ncbi:unnamed protein product [Merluccius merluccius]